MEYLALAKFATRFFGLRSMKSVLCSLVFAGGVMYAFNSYGIHYIALYLSIHVKPISYTIALAIVVGYRVLRKIL